jgi:preprotein translocase subunit SecY
MQSSESEIFSRVFFVIIGIIVYRFGSYIPIPGIDPIKLTHFFQSSGMLSYFNMFSGGALSRMTIFALGIMPYISSSIIIQLLSSVVSSLKELKKQGESGQRQITQYTRYLTLVLAFIQSFGVSKFVVSFGFVTYPSFVFYLISVVTLTTGSVFLMWLGEQITERGIGNGISLLIFASIASGIPPALARTFTQIRNGNLTLITLFLIILFIIVITLFVVRFERAQRRITVNYAKRQVGNKLYAGQSSHLPLKINMAGVIPPIFASSILIFPSTLAKWFSATPGLGWLNTVSLALSFGQPLFILVYCFAILFFCFFYTALVFDSRETAENLKKSGAFIPGIRPGTQTAGFINRVMSNLTLVGAVYIMIVCVVPMVFMHAWNVPFTFGGTSLLIVVVVVMDFIAQLQSYLMSSQYGNLMDKSKFRFK